MKAPIAIFAFNRPRQFARMIDSLKKNEGFAGREVFVFVDGPRNSDDQPKIKEVIELACSFTAHVISSPTNKGLAASVIAGVSKLMDKYGLCIVIEDDLVLMPSFLPFMDEALDFYADDERIFSVCGYGLKIKRPKGYDGDVYLGIRSSSWGWATWKDRWDTVDWEVSDWQQLSESKKMQKAFNAGGSDMYGMLKDFMEGRNNSWAIRFCYAQHRQGRYSLHPFRSLVANEGFGIEATNCRQKYSRFKIELDDTGQPLSLPSQVLPSKHIITQNARYHSFLIRLYSWVRRKLNV